MAAGEVRWQGTRRRELDYVVQALTDVSRIRELLAPRVEYTAYALGQLEPALRRARAGTGREATPGPGSCCTAAAGWATRRS